MKKAQAAMEFLMTYGWALLVVLIVIGALAYIGVTGSSTFSGDQCTFPPGLICSSFKVDASGDASSGATTLGAGNEDIMVILQNGLGQSISNAIISVSDATIGSSSTCAAVTVEPASLSTWGEGVAQTFTINCNAAFATGDKFRATINLDYMAGGVTHTKVGQLVANVEA